MTAEVISIKDRSSGWLTGPTKCLGCAHEWVAVSPVGVVWLECPECGLEMGRRTGPVQDGDTHWECNCGNDLFKINPAGAYCARCGREQRFP